MRTTALDAKLTPDNSADLRPRRLPPWVLGAGAKVALHTSNQGCVASI